MVKLYSIIISALAIAGAAYSESCGEKFRGKCNCGLQVYNYQTRYVVNCTDQGFRDTTVLEYLPPQTEVIIFTGNYIEELPWNVFGAINDLVNLTIVDMSNNHIHEIRGKTYHHVPNVKRLILNHNNLSISRFDDDEYNHHHPRVFSNFINLMELHLTNAFSDNTSAELSADLHDIFVSSNLTKLVKLHLEQNEISKFNDKRVFCDLPSLLDLHLGDNLLKEINFNITCLQKLRFLDLERNKFEALRPHDMNMMDTLQAQQGRSINFLVDFTFNPFNCDCSINPLYEWMHKTNVTVRNRDYLKCYRNKKHEEVILSLNMKKCQKARVAKQDHTVTLVFVLICLSCILVLLVGSLIYVSKDKLKTMITPVVDHVSKKVQYTSIKNEEAPEQYV
ncbi:SLIT and NTRK-like protein 4 [Toxorhynchites rutilus septentrionalis]|uniref:SLIT and NTRK-like protein 4 n=1 Tax=Toxorhynchites rutilus septentrionalis TaxID=329112 RepID=UPI00247947C7|nr:SLIT and NTRK-like protein 4 [Toxorhynchites rutilus septentrionalis]XP_055636826.1 SLIT and NTRK-like protein 4 [Toxorhynchites rutilus septentrionalis]XP_055636827.1 SLIT and NTRK-like protein 4 [Toxorhynchites rutilus septentrionalis]